MEVYYGHRIPTEIGDKSMGFIVHWKINFEHIIKVHEYLNFISIIKSFWLKFSLNKTYPDFYFFRGNDIVKVIDSYWHWQKLICIVWNLPFLLLQNEGWHEKLKKHNLNKWENYWIIRCYFVELSNYGPIASLRG